jgi:hypothetical protein
MSSTIEGIMNRAHEIHRAHGGLVGYDLEDWLEAEREMAERIHPEHVRVEETPHGGPPLCDQERYSHK